MIEKYAGLIATIILLVTVAMGFYLKSISDEITASATVEQIGKVDNCSPLRNICQLELNNKRIGFSLPESVTYLQDFPVEVRLEGFVSNSIKNIVIDFSMSGMDMGFNRIKLEKQQQNIWTGKGKLALCASGRTDWIAAVIINENGQFKQAEYFFTVKAE